MNEQLAKDVLRKINELNAEVAKWKGLFLEAVETLKAYEAAEPATKSATPRGKTLRDAIRKSLDNPVGLSGRPIQDAGQRLYKATKDEKARAEKSSDEKWAEFGKSLTQSD